MKQYNWHTSALIVFPIFIYKLSYNNGENDEECSPGVTIANVYELCYLLNDEINGYMFRVINNTYIAYVGDNRLEITINNYLTSDFV